MILEIKYCVSVNNELSKQDITQASKIISLARTTTKNATSIATLLKK